MNSPYSQEFIDSQKQKLLTDLEKLEKELSDVATFDEDTGKYMPKFEEFNPGDSEDPEEAADETTNYEENISITRNLVKSLTEAKAALNSIEEGKYGYCEDEGKYLPEDRLKAYPAAAVCLDKRE